jgi:hypothetical protein
VVIQLFDTEQKTSRLVLKSTFIRRSKCIYYYKLELPGNISTNLQLGTGYIQYESQTVANQLRLIIGRVNIDEYITI